MATTGAGATLLGLASGIKVFSIGLCGSIPLAVCAVKTRFMKPRLSQDVPGFKYFQTVAQDEQERKNLHYFCLKICSPITDSDLKILVELEFKI
uniref:Uncharacterized protein n=1 Tax=Leersia perrieri TaxID=77586 RepID=A0A0D9X524_9ORYZ